MKKKIIKKPKKKQTPNKKQKQKKEKKKEQEKPNKIKTRKTTKKLCDSKPSFWCSEDIFRIESTIKQAFPRTYQNNDDYIFT